MFTRADRKEFKFIIPISTKDEIITTVREHTDFDLNAGGTSKYPIISQYYDNIHRDSYWEKHRGQQSRRKLRIRVYGSDTGDIPASTFIEIKHKHFGRGVKRRLQVATQHAVPIIEEQALSLVPAERLNCRSTRMVLNEINQIVISRDLKFLCTMRYDRQAFVGAEDAPDLRITFDTGIACRFNQLDLQPNDKRFEHYLLPEDQCILEVKTNSVIPTWLRTLVGNQKLVKQSFSKFCTALENHDPQILRTRTRIATLLD